MDAQKIEKNHVEGFQRTQKLSSEETQKPIHWIYHLSENQRGLVHPSVFENLPW